jgi:hypothetical protein
MDSDLTVLARKGQTAAASNWAASSASAGSAAPEEAPEPDYHRLDAAAKFFGHFPYL